MTYLTQSKEPLGSLFTPCQATAARLVGPWEKLAGWLAGDPFCSAQCCLAARFGLNSSKFQR